MIHQRRLFDDVIEALEDADIDQCEYTADVNRTVSQLLEQRDWRPVSGQAVDSRDTLIKNRVALGLGFGGTPMHRIAANHLFQFVSDAIDVGIEVLPVDADGGLPSRGVLSYERGLAMLAEAGRATPAVPLVLLGAAP